MQIAWIAIDAAGNLYGGKVIMVFYYHITQLIGIYIHEWIYHHLYAERIIHASF